MAEALNLRDEVEESMTEGDLPSQGGGYVPTILPAIHELRLPANIDQCWEAKDYEKKDTEGNVLTDAAGKPIVEQHLLLKFDKDNPMVVVGGDYDGLPATATISTVARRRGKKTDPNAPMVSDMTYFLRDGLNSSAPIKLRKDYLTAINQFAGAVIRIESGLSAQCDPERVRYVDDGAGGVIEDPDGTKGCGNPAAKQNLRAGQESRFYTSDFKVKRFQITDTGEVYNTRDEALEAAGSMGLAATSVKAIDTYTDRAICKTCGATLRGFFRIERFLKPLASVQRG